MRNKQRLIKNESEVKRHCSKITFAEILKRTGLSAVAISMLLAGCSHPRKTVPQTSQVRPRGAQLDNEAAIRIARQVAKRSGTNLADFKEPTVEYEPKDKTWLLLFWGKVAMPGNHFVVQIDDQTGTTRIIGGR